MCLCFEVFYRLPSHVHADDWPSSPVVGLHQVRKKEKKEISYKVDNLEDINATYDV